jgi:hypothetical protein
MKKTLIILGIFAVILIGILILFFTSLDRIVAAAIEHYGSVTTQTDVSVSSVNLKLKSGEGSINDLKIANPAGFSTPYAFTLGDISIKIDPSTITNDTIVIDSIIVSSPKVTYEINESGRANISVINEHIRQSRGEGAQEKSKDKSNLKLVIRRLEIEGSRMDVHVPVQPEPLIAKMPHIEITNLGKGGAPPGEIAAEILSVLVKNAGVAAAQTGVEKYLGKSIDEMKGELQKQLGKEAGEAVEGLSEKAGEEVKKLLGK